jgi:uncharacterized repeat protein (TIGR03803 family)
MDSSGNLYGTTAQGGAYKSGTVFELKAPAPSGVGWTESTLFSFNGTNGKFPEAGLIIDANGNFYGTTLFGGTGNHGTVFKLAPPSTSGGNWTESVLLSFNGANGAGPHDALTMDTDTGGNLLHLYGTAQSGGVYNHGTVFELTPPANGTTWPPPSILHSFSGALSSGPDGATPLYDSLILASGNLYGTTTKGGTNGAGIVFELTPTTGFETVLYDFGNGPTDGKAPGGLILNSPSGNLYGTTTGGGVNGSGTVFELTPGGETVLYSFGSVPDGAGPSGPIANTRGNLYGTTSSGGTGAGTVFELTPNGLGGWTEAILYSFNGSDGNSPLVGLITDASGNLYGTTIQGGIHGKGTVFELSPPTPTSTTGNWTESVLWSFNGPV